MLIEVGHQADGMREVDGVLERGPAFVVNEQERDPFGRVTSRKRGDHHLQEFTLAGAGRPADQNVSATRTKVDGEWAGDTHAERRQQLIGRCALPTTSTSRRRVRVRQQLVEGEPSWQRG
ncbi:MAG: hypothetical protein WKF82_10045 [Nocardioidaceae bacterium]